MEEKKRLTYLDMAKGFALLLVIIGHSFRNELRVTSVFYRILYDLIYRFQTSTLFVISGFCFSLSLSTGQKQRIAAFLTRKAKGYLLPFFSYSILLYAIFTLASVLPGIGSMLSNSGYPSRSLWDYLLCMLRNENPYAFHVWYLFTLFLFSITVYLLAEGLPGHLFRKILFLLALSAPGLYIFLAQGACWTIKGYFQQFLFFASGVLLSDQFIEKKKVTGLIAGGTGFVITLITVCNSHIQVMMSSVCYEYLIRFSALAIAIGILCAAKILEGRAGFLSTIGRKSMLIYLYHQPICCAFAGLILYSKLHFPAFAVCLICIGLSIVLPQIIGRIVHALKWDHVFMRIGLPC